MKKTLLLTALAMFSLVLLAQEQLPVQPNEQPQVQPAEPAPAPQALPEGRYQDTFLFPHAFIHADKEYPAGKYTMVLGEKDGQEVFFIGDARKELLFVELAIVKAHPPQGSKSHFHVNIEGTMLDKEYMGIRVTTQEQWRLAYFLIKK